jgi:hypothetical protein
MFPVEGVTGYVFDGVCWLAANGMAPRKVDPGRQHENDG